MALSALFRALFSSGWNAIYRDRSVHRRGTPGIATALNAVSPSEGQSTLLVFDPGRRASKASDLSPRSEWGKSVLAQAK